LTAFLMVNSLPKTRKAIEPSKIPAFPTKPSASNMSVQPQLFLFESAKKCFCTMYLEFR
jgi:hypothetical protein